MPPNDPDAWYAPDVRSQYEVHPGAVGHVRPSNAAVGVARVPTGNGQVTVWVWYA